MTVHHGWRCFTKGCPQSEVTHWSRKRGSKPGQWVHWGMVCGKCKRLMRPTGEKRKHYTLAELL